MHITINNCRLELSIGDITLEEVDLIVNAANPELAGGGGVDGAIHRRGGGAIMQETDLRYPQGCPTGSAVISTAGNLAARHIAHAVGPVWHGGTAGEPALLAGAIRRALDLAIEHSCRSVALPAISTGVYGYPLSAAAEVSLTAAADFLRSAGEPELVRFVLFGEPAFEAFAAVLGTLVR